jgi:RimJ/RimL family protein N-acetyltransferase
MRPALDVWLRPVVEDDIAAFYDHQRDPEAAWMVAFTREDAADREAFWAHWQRLLADDAVILRTVLVDGQVAGNIVKFDTHGQPEVGYWIGRQWWGRGVATQALRAFLIDVTQRPLHAAVARDNAASIRVLEKCGFAIVGEDRAFSNARREEVEQIVLRLDGSD